MTGSQWLSQALREPGSLALTLSHTFRCESESHPESETPSQPLPNLDQEGVEGERRDPINQGSATGSGNQWEPVGTSGNRSSHSLPDLNLKEKLTMSTCVPCKSVEIAIGCYGRLDRQLLPAKVRNPQTAEEYVVAFAVAAWSRGITPVCRDGRVVGFTGIGLEQLVRAAHSSLN